MKRTTLLLLTLLTLGGVLHAQVQNNMSHQGFLSARASVPFFQHDGMLGFGGGVSIGEWLLKPLAFQISADFDLATNHPSGATVNFFYGSAEFLWEPLATFGWFNQNIGNVYDNNKFPIHLYGLIGLGGVTRGGEDTLRSSGLFYDGDFFGMLGAQLSYGWGRNSLDIGARVLFLSNGFDKATDQSGKRALRLSVGYTHNFFDSPYHRRPSTGSLHPQGDWFVALGLGVNYSSFKFEHFFDEGMIDMLGFAPEVMVGKNYSNVWTIRFELSGLRAHEQYLEADTTGGRLYHFSYLHSDFMVNLNHLLKFTQGNRLSILPYLGAGPIWRYEHPTITFAADAGCMVRYYVDAVGDFYFDLKYTALPPRIGRPHTGGDYTYGTGLLTATIGYVFNFGRSTTRYNPPVNKVRNRF